VNIKDKFGRPLRDLRISITDRCNFRCSYCMPKEIFGQGYPFLPKTDLLTFEEITRLARTFVALGVRKIRLTGGEPLLRRDIEVLVEMLAQIPDIELAMTTNGSLLSRKVQQLKEAGLDRATISLDALDEKTFNIMNDVEFPVQRVLEGIQAAEDAGLAPIKINMVVKRGVNEGDILPMARYFHGSGHILRFIEFMDVGSTNGWRLDDVLPAKEIVAKISAEMPIEPLDPNYRGEVANRWRYKDGGGEIGVIASVTQPFCGDCTRLRLSAKGELFTCLFGAKGHDLRALVRSEAKDADILAYIADIWGLRQDRYSEIRSDETSSLPKVEMSYIGG
jgi:GTP 3',8-cyclase